MYRTTSNGVKGPPGPLRVQGSALALSSFNRLPCWFGPAPLIGRRALFMVG